MRYSLISAALLSGGVSAHGILYTVEGKNGVSMPGIAVYDGTPRDCVLNACGAQADTAIIRELDWESGKGTACGWTQGQGPVIPEINVSIFMGTNRSSPALNVGASGATGKEDDLSLIGAPHQRRDLHARQYGRDSSFWNLPVIGILGFGGKRTAYAKETIVADTAGQGAQKGLPTTDDDGVIAVIYRQVNEDGAGPMTAAIDPVSGGLDPKEFVTARIIRDVPGVGFGGLSIATNTNFGVLIKLPPGTVCRGVIAGVQNVCVVRLRNQGFAGPFGGAGVFTQSRVAKKRAIAYKI